MKFAPEGSQDRGRRWLESVELPVLLTYAWVHEDGVDVGGGTEMLDAPWTLQRCKAVCALYI
jgi:hypothetical protein